MKDREKQIEEMARFLEESYGRCDNFSDCTNRKCSQCYAEDLYNAGYRKADEVRKETAKEILSYVGNLYDDCDQRFKLKDYTWHKRLCEKYGVEVEE